MSGNAIEESAQRPTALITGASGGIGLDLARLLAESGHDVVLVARSAAKLEELARDLSGRHGVRCEVLAADLARPEGVEAVVAGVEQRGMAVDVLVNNAGFGLWGEFAETDLAKELEMIQLNIATLTGLTKRFLPGMLQRKRGRVLNVASTAAFQPGPLMAVYFATKAYVLSFSEAIANELAGTGVTVTVLCPGPTETGFVAAAKMEESNLFKSVKPMGSLEVARRGLQGLIAGKRVVVPGLLNRVMAFFASFVPRRLLTAIVRRMQERVRPTATR
ncbi:MAG: SDR family oxidoreductase [Deltaproteobacteria bacterium]|nr:SDR family oxidoreductase [Deltaproteobacteria bacterium]